MTSLRHTVAALVLLSAMVVSQLPIGHLAAQDFEIGGEVIVDEVTSRFPQGMEFLFEAETEEAVDRAELLYTVADSKTANLATPKFDPGTSVTIEHMLDLQLQFQPSGVDITYRWRLHSSDGGVFESDPKTILWYDDRFDWDSIGTDDVTVYAYNGDADFNAYILNSAQTTVDQLKAEYGLDSTTMIRIWIYDSRSTFYETQAPNSSEWIAGTAFPQYHVIIVTIPVGDYREVDRVIPHEIAHQVVGEVTDNPFNVIPTWLDEGLAVELQEVGKEDYPAVVQDAYLRGSLPTVQSLISDFPFDAGNASLAYASSYSIVTFIREAYGSDALRSLVLAYQEGLSHDEALFQTLGIMTEDLTAQWRAYVAQGL